MADLVDDAHEGLIENMCQTVLEDIAHARGYLNEAQTIVAAIKNPKGGLVSRMSDIHKAADNLGVGIGHLSKARLRLVS